MSTSEEILHQVVLEDKLWIIGNYTIFSSTILWVIDLLQTLPMEISVVWPRKPSGTAVVFLLNRYTFGIYLILNVVLASPGSASNESCSALEISARSFQTVALFTSNLLITLRVYAITLRNKTFLCVALMLILVRAGVDLWIIAIVAGISTTGSQFEAFSKCGETNVDTQNANQSTVVVAAMPLMLDTLVFAITLIKIYRHFLEMRRYNQMSLAGLLLRDGALYFFVVSTIAAAEFALLLISVLNGSQTQLLLSGLLTAYFTVLPNLLVNRLYLNLRAMNRQNDTVTPEHNGMPEMAFAQDRFLGNIGAPLDPDWWNTQFDDDEGDGDELTVQDGLKIPTGNNGVTTLVPVIYEGEGHGEIEMVPIHRGS